MEGSSILAWSPVRGTSCRWTTWLLAGKVYADLVCLSPGQTTTCLAYLLVVGHRLEIIIDHRLDSVAAVDATF